MTDHPLHNSMKELPVSERPYEKFLTVGVAGLSDADLLAIILRSGTPDRSAIDIARELLGEGQKNLLNLYELSYEELLHIRGIGKIKAIQLKAIAELSARIASSNRAERMQMNSPSTIADYYMERMRHLKEEHLFCVFFDLKCHYLGEQEISFGSSDHVMICHKEILRHALHKGADSIVLLHNHPSGDPSPSDEDREATSRIRDACSMCGISLSDHIIIGDNRYFSFFEENKEFL